MNPAAGLEKDDDRLLAKALAAASDTKSLELGHGAIARAADVLRDCLGGDAAAIVADANTWEAAGRRTTELLRDRGIATVEPILFDPKGLYAEYAHVERLRAAFSGHKAAPVAVGSGTINDLVKLASHQCGRPYLVVASAASMDGYAAFGASITRDGLKQTFACPAPRAVIADMDVLCRAPAELATAGYGDLAAKVTAGADWIVADELGVEPLVEPAWSLVQERLRDWIADADAVGRRDAPAIRRLMVGLLMTGFAMQSAQSSRPGSGAEHQFSHLWDMEHHTHDGRSPYHGWKVAIGTLAVAALYDHLLRQPLDQLPVEDLCRKWPSLDERLRRVEAAHESPTLQHIARTEVAAKYIDREALAVRLRRLQGGWAGLRKRLRRQLMRPAELVDLFQRAGVPWTPSAIGITTDRLQRSVIAAQQIRRRYTSLDLALETGFLESSADVIVEHGVFTKS